MPSEWGITNFWSILAACTCRDMRTWRPPSAQHALHTLLPVPLLSLLLPTSPLKCDTDYRPLHHVSPLFSWIRKSLASLATSRSRWVRIPINFLLALRPGLRSLPPFSTENFYQNTFYLNQNTSKVWPNTHIHPEYFEIISSRRPFSEKRSLMKTCLICGLHWRPQISLRWNSS